MIRYFSSLRVRLLALVLLAVLPLLALTLYSGIEQKQQQTARVEDEALRLALSISSDQQSLIDSTHQLLMAIAQVPSLRQHNMQVCRTLFIDLLKLYPIYSNLAAFDLDGIAFCSALGKESIDPARCSWFKQVQQTHAFVVGGYEITEGTHKAALVCAQPVLDDLGNLQAVVTAPLDLHWLKQLTGDFPPGTEVFAIDRNGNILSMLPEGEKPADISVLFKSILARRQGTLETSAPDRVRRLYAFTPLGTKQNTGAYVALGIPSKLAYAEANKNMVRNLIALSILAILAVAAAWFGGDIFILRKVKRLVGMTEQVAGGDLSARTHLSGEGELNHLGRAFDQMADKLEQREQERKQAEEEIRNSAEKVKLFAYSVSHDLKSPAIGIYGLTKLLNNQYQNILDQKGRTYCEQILRASEQIAALVEKINIYISTKEDQLCFQVIDLKELLQMVREEFSTQLDIRRINWIVPDSRAKLIADRLCLLRVFRNLIDNALKYGADKLSEIRIGYEQTEDFHVLSVKDNGIGIRKEDSEKIFGLFQRHETSKGVEGAGLGLAIVKEIAEQHDGRAWVEPVPTGGTAFFISLSKDLGSNLSDSTHL